jgi:hypothetical protein
MAHVGKKEGFSAIGGLCSLLGLCQLGLSLTCPAASPNFLLTAPSDATIRHQRSVARCKQYAKSDKGMVYT